MESAWLKSRSGRARIRPGAGRGFSSSDDCPDAPTILGNSASLAADFLIVNASRLLGDVGSGHIVSSHLREGGRDRPSFVRPEP
jgi:hypothetical protein